MRTAPYKSGLISSELEFDNVHICTHTQTLTQQWAVHHFNEMQPNTMHAAQVQVKCIRGITACVRSPAINCTNYIHSFCGAVHINTQTGLRLNAIKLHTRDASESRTRFTSSAARRCGSRMKCKCRAMRLARFERVCAPQSS